MLRLFLGGHGSVLPLIVLVACFVFFVLVAFYVATDRRTSHQRRMGALPLDGDASRG